MKSLGIIAERKAANYLRKKKYEILDFNYRCKFGEIDVIAKKDNFIVFIEVKARGENSIASPADFVDYTKQKKIISTAQLYIASNNIELQPRFDVIEVYIKKDRIKSIKHLENAFTLD